MKTYKNICFYFFILFVASMWLCGCSLREDSGLSFKDIRAFSENIWHVTGMGNAFDEFVEESETPVQPYEILSYPHITSVTPEKENEMIDLSEESDDKNPLEEYVAGAGGVSIEAMIAAEEVLDNDKCINILLAGVDRRKSTGRSRADTIMIGTIDLENKCIKLTSILRDTLVYVPHPVDDYRKINATSSKGGMELLMRTVNYNFGLNIDSYVMVDFEMFTQLIDQMGGVEMELTAKEISAANDCIAGLNKQTGYDLRDGFIIDEAGIVRLTGKQALGFARIRKMDSDFKRTERQFELLQTAFSQFLDLPITTQYSVLYNIFPYIETNIENNRIIGLGAKVLSTGLQDMAHFQIPAKGMYKSGTYDGSYALLADMEKNAAALHNFIAAAPQQQLP